MMESPLEVPLDGNAATSSLEVSIPSLGSVTLESAGLDPVKVGAAQLVADRPVGGVIRFGVTAFGIAGVGVSSLVDAFLIPIVRDVASGLSTGVAIFSQAPGTLRLTLNRLDGVQQAQTEVEIAEAGHISSFVEEFFSEIGDFEGTLLVEGSPLGATALQLGVGKGRFTTLPAVSAKPLPAASDLHFAQFADGDGIVTSIFLVNPSSSERAMGNLRFFDNDGEELSVGVNGMAPASQIPIDIPPRGGGIFTTDGIGDQLVGSARAILTDGVLGGVLRFSLPTFGIAGVGASGALDAFITPVRATAAGMKTGVAIAATGGAVTLDMVLRNVAGDIVPGGQAEQNLPANGHLARFLDQLFPEADTAEFEGTLTVTAQGGQIAATALELGTEAGQFTTLPVTAVF